MPEPLLLLRQPRSTTPHWHRRNSASTLCGLAVGPGWEVLQLAWGRDTCPACTASKAQQL